MSPLYFHGPQFESLLAHRDNDVALLPLMLEFARDAYPELLSEAFLERVDDLAAQAQERIGQMAGLRATAPLDALCDVLYAREGFRGNQDAYYDPRNSYLNEVLARRLGIPISLSILYMSVGRRAGLDCFGVATPGHFVMGCRAASETWYLDPFTDGAVLDQSACRDRIHEMLGQRGVLTSEHFRPATTLEIAARVLRNLKAAHAMRDNWPQALPVQQRLVALLPEVADERRDLGLIYLRNGDPHRASRILEEYVQSVEEESALPVLPFLKSARRMAAERN